MSHPALGFSLVRHSGAMNHERRIGDDTVASQVMGTNAERRGARERVSAYHQAQALRAIFKRHRTYGL
jgi:hypothetical protein